MIDLKQHIVKNKFRLYFCFLLVFLIIEPLPTPALVDNILAWLLLGIFCFSPYIITQKRKALIVPVAMLGTVFLNRILEDYECCKTIRAFLTIFNLAQYFAVIIYLLWYTVRQQVMTNDMIFSGLTGFFLLGIGFSFIYTVNQDLGFASYITTAGTVNSLTDSDLIYFSFSNISALGIGDITPNTDFLKRLTVLQSAIGTLYVAVFIGRLVGMSGIHHRPGKQDSH